VCASLYNNRRTWLDAYRKKARHNFKETRCRSSGGGGSSSDQTRASARIATKAQSIVNGNDDATHHPGYDLMSMKMHRLYIEDSLFLDDGDHLLLCVSRDHPGFSSYQEIITEFEQSEGFFPPPVSMGDKDYYQFNVTVGKCNKRDRIVMAQLTVGEWQEEFSHQQGASIHLSIAELPHVAFELKYMEVLVSRDCLKLYGVFPRSRNPKASLAKRSNIQNRLDLFTELLAECEGDSAMSLDLCNSMNSIMDEDEINKLNYNSKTKLFLYGTR
jgi:hypothetical protein